jgi:hypothetical protein
MTGPQAQDVTSLERRYRRLLTLYPADYRATREDEMVGTFLATAQRLGFLDVVDVLRGAARQRVRANAATTGDARNTASTIALAAAVTLAAVWFVLVECAALPPAVLPWVHDDPTRLTRFDPHRFGPFATLGAVVWLAWLATGALALAGRARPATMVSLAFTLAVVPASALSGVNRPALLVLVPQVALGAVAAAWPVRPQWTARLFVAGCGLAGLAYGAAQLHGGGSEGGYYWWGTRDIKGVVAVGLLLCGFVVGMAGSLRGDARSPLVLPILAVPATLLLVDRITGWLLDNGYGSAMEPLPTFGAVTGGILAVAVLAYAGARGYRRRIRGTAQARDRS